MRRLWPKSRCGLPPNSAAPNSSWCRWSRATDGLIAYPSGKGRGAITSFAQADGFLKIDALADQMPAGTEAEVTLFTPHVRVPDLVIVGSHCTGLDLVTAPLARAGLFVRSIAVGSLGGLAAAKRGECDLAPIHLFDEKTETYNMPFLRRRP